MLYHVSHIYAISYIRCHMLYHVFLTLCHIIHTISHAISCITYCMLYHTQVSTSLQAIKLGGRQAEGQVGRLAGSVPAGVTGVLLSLAAAHDGQQGAEG